MSAQTITSTVLAALLALALAYIAHLRGHLAAPVAAGPVEHNRRSTDLQVDESESHGIHFGNVLTFTPRGRADEHGIDITDALNRSTSLGKAA